LAASPGGTTANLFSHLAHGDVALNITLTAVNSLIAILTMPLLVNLSLIYFMESDQAIPLQFAKVMQVFAIVLLPVGLGMLIRRYAPGFAARMEKPMKLVAALFLASPSSWHWPRTGRRWWSTRRWWGSPRCCST